MVAAKGPLTQLKKNSIPIQMMPARMCSQRKRAFNVSTRASSLRKSAYGFCGCAEDYHGPDGRGGWSPPGWRPANRRASGAPTGQRADEVPGREVAEGEPGHRPLRSHRAPRDLGLGEALAQQVEHAVAQRRQTV